MPDAISYAASSHFPNASKKKMACPHRRVSNKASPNAHRKTQRREHATRAFACRILVRRFPVEIGDFCLKRSYVMPGIISKLLSQMRQTLYTPITPLLWWKLITGVFPMGGRVSSRAAFPAAVNSSDVATQGGATDQSASLFNISRISALRLSIKPPIGRGPPNSIALNAPSKFSTCPRNDDL